MYKLLGTILILISSTFVVKAQLGFQRVYDQSVLDSFSKITDVYCDGDQIYFSGGGYGLNNSFGLRFGKIDSIGDLTNITRYDILNHLQRAIFSNVDIDTNFRGNLVNFYESYDIGTGGDHGVRLIEYSLNGDIIFDTLYTHFWSQDSLSPYDHTKLLHIRSDSTYLINFNHRNEKTSSSEYEVSGTTLMKVNYDGDIMWTKHYYNDFVGAEPQWAGQNISIRDDTIFFHVMEIKQYGGSAADLSWARQLFLKLDMNGNILNQDIFFDGQNCIAFNSSLRNNNAVYLQYFDSKVEWNGNTPYFLFLPMLAKLDESHSIVWKRSLFEVWNVIRRSFSIQSMEVIGDSSLVGAHFNLQVYDSVQGINKGEVRLFNFSTSDGNINWFRDYHYYPLNFDNKDAIYEISDLEIMSDGGYVLGGNVYNYNFAIQDLPNTFSYLLRTNCLGFLSPPSAQFSYSNYENEVLFVNNSMNAGSYSWYFGEGDTLYTGEDQDSVYHTYEYGGAYDVTLIGHGCNGEADTVTLTIDVEQGAYGNIGDDYFTIYPNPIESGGLITVETGNVQDAELFFFDAQGRKVKEVYLPNEKSIYFIEQAFAAGIYSARLIKDGRVLQDSKIVVN